MATLTRCAGSGDQVTVGETRPSKIWPHDPVADVACPECDEPFAVTPTRYGTGTIPTHRRPA